MRGQSPRYAEIAQRLREDIAAGRIKPGEQLPTERELMDQFDVSVTVARTAVAQLRNEGIVESRQGKGSFVRERRELIRYASRRYRRTGLAPNRRESLRGGWLDEVTSNIRVVTASAEIAERLGINAGEQVSEVEYHWFADGEPVQLSTQWEPLSITRGTSIEQPSSGTRGDPDTITRFDSIGLHVTHVQEYIRARMPRPNETGSLRMPEGVPIIHITRTHFVEDTAVETADILIRADRIVIENVNEVPVIESSNDN